MENECVDKGTLEPTEAASDRSLACTYMRTCMLLWPHNMQSVISHAHLCRDHAEAVLRESGDPVRGSDAELGRGSRHAGEPNC